MADSASDLVVRSHDGVRFLPATHAAIERALLSRRTQAMHSILVRYQPVMLSILRTMTALLFLEHGLMKLLHFPVPQPGVSGPLPPLLLVAALVETIAGSLLIIGLFTRAVAFLTAGQLAVAYFVAHAPQGFWPGANGGDAAVLFCFVFLYLIFAGGGSLSVDAVRRRTAAAWNGSPEPEPRRGASPASTPE